VSRLDRCDNCAAEKETSTALTRPLAEGWIQLEWWEPDPNYEKTDRLPVALRRVSRHFCSWRCLGEYMVARQLIESAGDGGGQVAGSP